MCRAPGESAKSRSFCCFPYFCWRKIWVCLYFQIWLLDVFGQAIFTVFNQVSPVTSSVGPARHTLHTLVFERKSFEFHCLTWKLNRVENTKKQTRKFRKASKVSTWLFNVSGWWKVRARISPFFAQVEKTTVSVGFSGLFHEFCPVSFTCLPSRDVHSSGSVAAQVASVVWRQHS